MYLPFPRSFIRKNDDVHDWLSLLKRFFTATELAPNRWHKHAPIYLGGEPLRLWEEEERLLKEKDEPVTLENFTKMLIKEYDTPLLTLQYREQYEHLTQDGTVTEYVRKVRCLVLRIAQTKSPTGPGDVMYKFLQGLQPAVKLYVQ